MGPLRMAIVFPTEGNLPLFEREQALIGDGDAVGITTEILQHLARPAEGWLGIDDPFFFAERSQIAAELLERA